jgi:hypothetical protein
MPERDPRDAQVWETGWQGHADGQRARIARLSLPAKLHWLEEAQHLLTHLRRGPMPRGGDRGSLPASPSVPSRPHRDE